MQKKSVHQKNLVDHNIEGDHWEELSDLEASSVVGGAYVDAYVGVPEVPALPTTSSGLLATVLGLGNNYLAGSYELKLKAKTRQDD